jgi:gliding motility-associated-like protein
VPQAAGQNVLWYEGFPGSGDLNAPAVDGTEVGTHVFWATQNNWLCQSDTSRLTLVINEWPFFELPDTLVLCEGDLFTVGPTAVPEWNYMWSDGQTITPRAVSSAGIYWLEAVNNCGGHTDSTLVVIDDCMCYFYMPNAITPNGDGSNEVFKPVNDCSMENYQLLVFNRWGQVVFETTDPYQEWNATDQGFGLVQDGVYVWSVQFTETETGETVRHTGHVVVLK